MAIWAGFWVLGVIWGASFLLIKIGVAEFTPLQLVAVRISVAAVAMLVTLFLTKQRFPKDRASLLGLLVVGTFNTAIPFFLITWGEQSIDSGLATVLNSTVPLFSLVIAHFALTDERITPLKVAGLLAGFFGVIVLTSRSIGVTTGGGNSIAGQVAVLAASLCYAGTTVFVRRNLRHLNPLVVSSGALVTAAVMTSVIMLLVDGPPQFGQISGQVTAVVLVLGLVNTYIAYLLFYWIIDQWGATRATLVTYVMPPVGLALGVIFLDESLDARLIAGSILIGAGVALVNWRRSQPETPAETSQSGESTVALEGADR